MVACFGPEDDVKKILSVQHKNTTSVHIKNKKAYIWYKITRNAFQ